MTKTQIIKKLQQMKWLDSHWRLKDFTVIDTYDKIFFCLNYGDMGLINKIIYYKFDELAEVYELNNYYGDTTKIASVML